MKRLVISMLILLIVSFSLVQTFAETEEVATDRFEKVVNRMVKAINGADYAGIQKDFSKVMLDAFPLEQSEPFFKNLSAQYGKIQKLDSAQLIAPNQAIFPTHFERGILDIKVVLDEKDKIIGLWFLPHNTNTPIADVNAVADANAVAGPNAVEAKAEEFEGLEKALENLNRDGERHISAWMRGADEGRIRLAKAVQEEVATELNFIREFAVEEGAVITTEAIDRLLASRTERFERLIERMEEERRQERLREREDRRRGRDRDTRRRDREDRRSRDRSSTRRDPRDSREQRDPRD